MENAGRSPDHPIPTRPIEMRPAKTKRLADAHAEAARWPHAGASFGDIDQFGEDLHILADQDCYLTGDRATRLAPSIVQHNTPAIVNFRRGRA
jgi:hypothetical protein